MPSRIPAPVPATNKINRIRRKTSTSVMSAKSAKSAKSGKSAASSEIKWNDNESSHVSSESEAEESEVASR
jgi:hypothetical protein